MKQYIKSYQAGGSSPWVREFRQPQTNLPLAAKLQMQQQEQAKKSSSKSEKSPGMDLSELEKMEKANYADKHNIVTSLKDKQAQYNQMAAQMGEWWMQTADARKMQNQIAKEAINSTTLLHNTYEHLNNLESAVSDNEAENAYVSAGPEHVLALNQETGEIAGVSFEEAYNKRDRYKKLKTQDLINLRRMNPEFQKFDPGFEVTNLAGNIIYGTKLTDEFTKLLNEAEKDTTLKALKTAASNTDTGARKRVTNGGKWEVTTNRRQINTLVHGILSGKSDLPDSVINGLRQLAAQRVETYGVPEGSSYKEEYAQRLKDILLLKAEGMTATKMVESKTSLVESKAKAEAAAQSQYDKMDATMYTVGKEGKGDRVSVSFPDMATDVSGVRANITEETRHLGSAVNRRALDDSKMKLKIGDSYEAVDDQNAVSDIMASTSIERGVFLHLPVDEDGNAVTDIIPPDKKQSVRENAKLLSLVTGIGGVAKRLMDEHGMDSKEATKKAYDDTMQQIADEYAEELGVDEGDVEAVKRELPLTYEFKEFFYIEGITSADYADQGGWFTSGNKVNPEAKIAHNRTIKVGSGSSADDVGDAYRIKMLIPLASNYIHGQKMASNDEMVDYDMSLGRKSVYNRQGGKLISFNDLK